MSQNTQIPCRSEFHEQVAVVDYMRKFYSNVLFFATGNGLKLPIGLAVKFKRMGNNRGVPDLVFPEPERSYKGLFIEMKRLQGGRVRPEQTQWIEALRLKGYCVSVCYGFEEAKKVIDWYLG